MWPWEHLAVGYLLYWSVIRLRPDRTQVTGGAALAVAFGTQFPDLVDKSMAWVFGIFPSGVSVAHSIITATVLSAAVVLVAGRLGRQRAGTAFVVGYLSHIPADLLYPVLLGEQPLYRAFIWPLATAEGSVRQGFLANFAHYFLRFVEFLSTTRGVFYLSMELLLLLSALTAWIFDGCPGTGWLFRRTHTVPSVEND